MKIRIYSDIHLEFARYHAPFDKAGDEDLVVLAGDIDVGVGGVNWARETFPHVPVIYVLGNHEFYGFDFNELVKECQSIAQGTNVHVLERGSVDIGGIRVLGTTLWTDFEALGADSKQRAMHWADTKMYDYFGIKDAGRRLLPKTTEAACHLNAQWLDAQIGAADRPLLVVTHHSPTMATSSPHFARVISNAAFHSRLDHLLRPPVRMWVHGHTHHCVDKLVNGVHMVANQFGYPGEKLPGFRSDGLFHLGV